MGPSTSEELYDYMQYAMQDEKSDEFKGTIYLLLIQVDSNKLKKM